MSCLEEALALLTYKAPVQVSSTSLWYRNEMNRISWVLTEGRLVATDDRPSDRNYALRAEQRGYVSTKNANWNFTSLVQTSIDAGEGNFAALEACMFLVGRNLFFRWVLTHLFQKFIIGSAEVCEGSIRNKEPDIAAESDVQTAENFWCFL